MTQTSPELNLNEKLYQDEIKSEYFDILKKMRESGYQYTQNKLMNPNLILKRPTTEPLDDIALDAIQRNPNLIVPWILIGSYLYYCCDFSILSDQLFDSFCHLLQKRYDSFTHRHKTIVTQEHLRAGSLYDLTPYDYPSIVRGSSIQLVFDHYGTHAKDNIKIVTDTKTGERYIQDGV